MTARRSPLLHSWLKPPGNTRLFPVASPGPHRSRDNTRVKGRSFLTLPLTPCVIPYEREPIGDGHQGTGEGGVCLPTKLTTSASVMVSGLVVSVNGTRLSPPGDREKKQRLVTRLR